MNILGRNCILLRTNRPFSNFAISLMSMTSTTTRDGLCGRRFSASSPSPSPGFARRHSSQLGAVENYATQRGARVVREGTGTAPLDDAPGSSAWLDGENERGGICLRRRGTRIPRPMPHGGGRLPWQSRGMPWRLPGPAGGQGVWGGRHPPLPPRRSPMPSQGGRALPSGRSPAAAAAPAARGRHRTLHGLRPLLASATAATCVAWVVNGRRGGGRGEVNSLAGATPSLFPRRSPPPPTFYQLGLPLPVAGSCTRFIVSLLQPRTYHGEISKESLHMAKSPWRVRSRASGVTPAAVGMLLVTAVLLREACGGLGRPLGRRTAASGGSGALPLRQLLFHYAVAVVRDGGGAPVAHPPMSVGKGEAGVLAAQGGPPAAPPLRGRQHHDEKDGSRGVAPATAPIDRELANPTQQTEPPVVAGAVAAGGAPPRAGSSSSGGSKPTSSSSSSGNRPTGGNRPSSSSHSNSNRWDDDDEPAMPWRVGLSIVGGLLGFMFLVGVWIVVMNMRADRKEAKEQERGRAGVAADAEYYDT